MVQQTRTTIDPEKGREPQHGPAGDRRPNPDAPDQHATRGQPPEAVEDRPGVGQVRPDDYPAKASGKDVT